MLTWQLQRLTWHLHLLASTLTPILSISQLLFKILPPPYLSLPQPTPYLGKSDQKHDVAIHFVVVFLNILDLYDDAWSSHLSGITLFNGQRATIGTENRLWWHYDVGQCTADIHLSSGCPLPQRCFAFVNEMHKAHQYRSSCYIVWWSWSVSGIVIAIR